MSGVFIAVVGPSGAGKDSVIAYARERLGQHRVSFVRRIITRTSDAGSEQHDTMDATSFESAAKAGAFALSWHAHGLHYGLPIGLEDCLASGHVVIANVSRAVIPVLMVRYPGAIVVAVTANNDVIAKRLAARGRETAAAIARRMDRSIGMRLPVSTVTIDNSGPLETAGERFTDLVRDVLCDRSRC